MSVQERDFVLKGVGTWKYRFDNLIFDWVSFLRSNNKNISPLPRSPVWPPERTSNPRASPLSFTRAKGNLRWSQSLSLGITVCIIMTAG